MRDRLAGAGGRRSSYLQELVFLASALGARADDPVKGDVKVIADGGFVRLLFHFDQAVESNVRVSGAIIVITFKKPVAVAVEKLNSSASGFVSVARRDPDGGAIRIALAHKVKVNSIAAAERLYVDLLPENWNGPTPGLPQEVIDELVRRAREAESQLHQQKIADKQKKPPLVRVKVAAQPTFIRYIFTMPGTINVVPERADGKVTLNFDQQVNWDLADAKASMPPTLKSIESEVDFDTVAVVFTLNGTPQVRTFREDRSIIVDIGLDAAAKPKPTEGSAKQPVVADGSPAITRPQTAPAKDATPPADPKPPAPPPPVGAPAEARAAQAAQTAKEQPKPAETPAPPMEARASPPPAEVKAPSDAGAAAAAVSPSLSPAGVPAAASPVRSADAATPTSPPAPPVEMARPSQRAPTADAERPVQNPNAVVVAGVQQSGETMRIEFPFATATPAAVFQRADTLWLVFDTPTQIDLTAMQADNDNGVREVLFERTKDGVATIRLKLDSAKDEQHCR